MRSNADKQLTSTVLECASFSLWQKSCNSISLSTCCWVVVSNSFWKFSFKSVTSRCLFIFSLPSCKRSHHVFSLRNKPCVCHRAWQPPDKLNIIVIRNCFTWPFCQQLLNWRLTKLPLHTSYSSLTSLGLPVVVSTTWAWKNIYEGLIVWKLCKAGKYRQQFIDCRRSKKCSQLETHLSFL